MAKDETKRLPPGILADDEEIFAALRGIKDYTPANPAYAMERLEAARNNLMAAQMASVQAQAAADAARDTLVARQWEFHNLILGTKDQIVAQYGADSDEVQAVKLKKKTEYSARKSKSKSGSK